MAIIDTLRFRNIMVDGEIASEEAAQEFVVALDETFEDATGHLSTKKDLAVLRAELVAEIRGLEARMSKFILLTVGLQLTALGIAVALILGLN